MLTGREALFSIEQAISRVRADEGRLDAALRSAMDEAARLRREEANGFRVLARVRLDAMMREQVIGALDADERRALAMIENHVKELDALARRRAEQQAALDKAEAAKHDCDQDLADALEALDEQRHRTAERIQSDASWRAAKSAVETAEKIAANADEKASQAEADLAAKGKPYEDDPLFIYLWRKKHGQADDRSGLFVRFFDRKVAGLVGYREARANYAMLQEIPLRLREHAKNKQSDVETAKARVAEVERQALIADGIEPLEAKGAVARAAVEKAEQAVATITAALQIDGLLYWAQKYTRYRSFQNRLVFVLPILQFEDALLVSWHLGHDRLSRSGPPNVVVARFPLHTQSAHIAYLLEDPSCP